MRVWYLLKDIFFLYRKDCYIFICMRLNKIRELLKRLFLRILDIGKKLNIKYFLFFSLMRICMKKM